MNRASIPPRLFLLIALAAIACCIASVSYQRVSAQATNGRLAFTSDNVIYTINPDGSGLIQLTQTGNGFFDRFPDWSPDGTKIVFGRTTFTVSSKIYVMNADGSNATPLTSSAGDQQPSWSPDGTKIAFVSGRDGNDEIYVMNADGSNQTRLTSNASFDFDPTWSPDGTKIAFTSTRDFPGITGNIANGFEVYVMGADGSNPIRLTNNSASDVQPSWSPDGTRIAFTTQRTGLPLVFVMNANGSNQVNITQSTTLDSADPEWSPDGTTIAFTSFNRVGQTNAGEVFFMNADGSNIRRITTASFDEHDLSWQPLGTTPSPTPTPTPTPIPSPSPSFTVSGTVTNGTGQGLADVTMVLLSDVTGTQITFTDQSGNYVFNYVGGVSHSLNVTPSKSGFVFNPIATTFVSSSSLSGDRTASFVGTQTPLSQLIQMPFLLTQENSQRAVALDSVTLMSESFGVTGINNFSTDQRTRISLFAVNVELGPGETASVIEAQAEDSLGQVFPLTIEHFGAVPNLPWLKQLIVKLPLEIANSVEVRVSLKARGIVGNKVLVKVKP